MSRLSVVTTVRYGLSMTFHGFIRFSCFDELQCMSRLTSACEWREEVSQGRSMHCDRQDFLAPEFLRHRNQRTMGYQVSQNPLVDFRGLLDTNHAMHASTFLQLFRPLLKASLRTTKSTLMRHPRRRSRTHPRGFPSMQRSDEACRLLVAALLVCEDILMAYDRSLIVADPRRCEPKKFGGARVRTEWSTDWWDLICFSECIPVKGIWHRTSLSKNASSLCPAQVALPVPASRSPTDEQLKPIAVILVTPRGKCLEVDSYKRLREKKCRSWTVLFAMHLRGILLIWGKLRSWIIHPPMHVSLSMHSRVLKGETRLNIGHCDLMVTWHDLINISLHAFFISSGFLPLAAMMDEGAPPPPPAGSKHEKVQVRF